MNVTKYLKARFMAGAKQGAAVIGGVLVFCGNAQAVERGSQGINAIKAMLETWLPVAAGIAVVMVAMGYWFDWVSRDFLVRFAKGMLAVAMGSWLINLFIGG